MSGAEHEALHSLFRYAQVGRCVDGVTHDINNFLGAAQAYAELVQLDNQLSSESRRMLGEIVGSIERCAGLISTLTAISRKERPGASLLDPGALAQEIGAVFEYTCRVRKISLEVQAPVPGPAMVGDTARLQWAVVFLLWRAVDSLAGQPGSRIQLVLEQEEGFVTYRVSCGGASGTTATESGARYAAGLMERLTAESLEQIAQLHQGTVQLEACSGSLRVSRRLRLQDLGG